MRISSLPCLTTLFVVVSPAPATAQESNPSRQFQEQMAPYPGLYRVGTESLVIGLIPSAEIIYFQELSSGATRFMGPTENPGEFRYSPTRNLTDQTEGTVRFRSENDGLASAFTWTRTPAMTSSSAIRVPASVEEVVFNNGDEAELHGTLIVPAGQRDGAAAVMISQSGRHDLWDVGMWLHDRGLAVLYFDRRNEDGGLSTGTTISGGYQDQQRSHAGDVLAAVEFLRTRAEINPEQIGVVGWSGGGFTGAFVAAGMPDLGFYVNIAGDASPGFEQASHMFVARLMRQGYSDEEVERARQLVDQHFGVATGDVAWQSYQALITEVADTEWYRYLTSRYSIPWQREAGILDVGRYQAEWPTDRVYGRIASVPTLGVFFEFDHSSAPSSPRHFANALRAAGNGNHQIVMIPDTHHGGYVLNGMGYRFDTSRLTGRSPILIDAIGDWVERQVR